MVNWRAISKDKYVVAGILTALIFILGLLLGLVIEDSKYNLVEEVNEEQDIKYLSLQLQSLYLSTFQSEQSCPILEASLQSAIEDLSDSLSEVVAFEEDKKASSKKKANVQRRYVLDNLRYWMLAQENKKRCDLDIVPILYFYKEECPSCPTQGHILSFTRERFEGQVLVFPINLDLRESEPMVQVLTSQFNVTKVPTTIVDEQKFEGVIREEQLKAVVCHSLEETGKC